MANLTGEQVAQVAYNAGWRGKDLLNAVSVSFAENTPHDPSGHNYCCYGLWQINLKCAGCEARGTVAEMSDPQKNADEAYRIWHQQGWGPWSTWPVAAAAHRGAARQAIAQANLSGQSTQSPGAPCADLYKQDPSSPAVLACVAKYCKQPPTSDAYFACSYRVTGQDPNAAPGIAGSIGSAFTSLEDAVKAFVGAFLWLLSPSHWVRIAEAVGGAVLVLLAIVFLFLYSHRDEVKGIARSVTP